MRKQLEDVREVEVTVAEFYEALNKMFSGDAVPMIALWSHSDDVTYLGPQGGILTGWRDIKAVWEDHAALHLGGKVEPQEVHIITDGDIAIVQNYEIGTNSVRGKTETVKIRATNLFRKENGRWRMISHQTDLLPYLVNIVKS